MFFGWTFFKYNMFHLWPKMSFLMLLDLEICISLGSCLPNVSAEKKAYVVSLFGGGATLLV
jgi:hypothetical protein